MRARSARGPTSESTARQDPAGVQGREPLGGLPVMYSAICFAVCHLLPSAEKCYSMASMKLVGIGAPSLSNPCTPSLTSGIYEKSGYVRVQGSETWHARVRLQNRIPKRIRELVRCLPVVRCVSGTNDAAPAGEAREDSAPPGCSRIKVELGRPLGLVLEENKNGGIFVAEILPGGNAEKAKVIEVGDELIATSAVVYNSEMDYGGVKVQKGQEIVRLAVRGEKFDTVMAAIGTHPAVIKVNLELQKC